MGNKNAAQTGKEDDNTTIKTSGLATNNQEQVTSAETAGTEVVALYQFEDEHQNTLAFAKDELLYVDKSRMDDEWWWAWNVQGREGYIPSNYVKPIAKPSGLVTNNQEKVRVWPAGTEVIGKFQFRGRNKEDLPFQKGERLYIESVSRDPKWYRAKNGEGRSGMIPYNYVRKKRAAVKLHTMPWFHPRITRERSEALLRPCEDGSFLVRESYNFPGDYTLSVRTRFDKVEHYRILQRDDNKLTVDDELHFDNLIQLVKHYEKDVDGLCTRLTIPIEGNDEEKLRGFFEFDVDPVAFREEGWILQRNDLHIGKVVEKDMFGDVVQAEYKGQKVSVKSPVDDKRGNPQALRIEAAIMTNLKHKNIVKLLGVSLVKNSFYIVTEFCGKGSLLNYLRKRGQEIGQSDLLRFARDIADGMHYLELKNLVHSDLKAGNVLLHEDGTAKVSNFVLAREANLNLKCGNVPFSIKWSAPELIKDQKISTQSDVWSYGVVLWELFSYGVEPYPGKTNDEAVAMIERGYRMDCPDGCLKEVYDIMRNCWSIDEKQRPTFKSICRVLAEWLPVEVPPEILARGVLALEAYNKALSEGGTRVMRVPLMVVGQDRSGKTSLKNSLMGKVFNPDEDSTVGIDADPSYFQVSTEVWKVGKKGEENDSEISISYEQHAARLAAEHLRQNPSTPNEAVLESTHTEGISQDKIFLESSGSDATAGSANSDLPISRSHDSAEVDDNKFHSKSSASDLPNAISEDTAKLPEVSEETRSLATSQAETSTVPETGDNIPDMPEDIAALIEMRLKEAEKVKDEEGIISVLWDFGGQSIYYTTHPLFLTTRAIFLLVDDLSRNPHERAKSVVKQGMFTKAEDSFDLRTNLDYLDFWMSSIASLGSSESNQAGPKPVVLPEKLPPVFFVCTHADTPYGGGDPCSLARQVFGSLQTKPYKSHLYDDIFVVDNTKSGHESECSEVVRLRNEILAVAKELPQMKEVIPIKWLRFEKRLQDMKENGHKWISLDDAKQIASEECSIVGDDQFHTLLNFLHDQRILIHFDDTPELNKMVVLDPQWMVDVFKEVITIRPYHGKEKEFKERWCKLENEGILDEKLLEHVWSPLLDSKETSESLIAVMEKFSLLCPFPSSNASCSKQYLVPSMLMSHPPEGIVELIKSARIPSLFLKFESGHIPLGFFPRLVLQFFQWVKDECLSPVDPQLYHNFARFYTSEEENCSVVLLCHSFSIEVVVHSGNASHDLAENLQSKLSLSEDASHAIFDVKWASAVRRRLELMFESMRNEFCWLKNMSYELSFTCPVCCEGGSVNYCRTHRAQVCKQEECLHFLSESQLCNAKSVSCTKCAVAQNNRVQIEQFAPWLLPRRNQPTADEQDGRNLASAEVSKEVALPGEVEEVLLSQSCDAKEIVLQAEKTMQLDQASLEQLEPETKSMIRTFARKAKDANRLDVFEHLREITPAGTTGPLLPENLDVRNIPASKGRKLTIDLCGGDEWIVVAEALGLTPQEIRFLDKRHLNPLDAALGFIAKQRLITVGDLYDLLNEKGFPLIADLL